MICKAYRQRATFFNDSATPQVMGLRVTLVSGPRRSGKSAVIRTMLDRVWKIKPHYLRLINSEKAAPAPAARNPEECGLSSARVLTYSADRIFEILPAALSAIHRRDRFGAVLIEADADPVVRHAYPYDHRIFVMPIPPRTSDVFRGVEEAAREFRRVLDDTQAFASEIFGMLSQPETDGTDVYEDRPDMSDSLMRGFLYSPLGDELATRIQLQAPYHGLVESDVIIVNNSIGAQTAESTECINRIDHLLSRLAAVSGNRAPLYFCDPRDPRDRDCKKLLKTLKPMCVGGS